MSSIPAARHQFDLMPRHRPETRLYLSTQAAQSGRRHDALGRTPDAYAHVDARVSRGGSQTRRDIAVGDQSRPAPRDCLIWAIKSSWRGRSSTTTVSSLGRRPRAGATA